VHGVPLPRDARDQAERGHAVEGGLQALRPGDLAFFSERADGRITHVGIALGGGRMGHVALGRGGFAVDELASEEAYVAALRERFRVARRLVAF
jgi:cell wall-associated NlpC family hydrolase